MPELDIHSVEGLSEEQAARRLMEDGPNELPASKRRSLLAIALDVLREPMLILLVACGALYLVLGEPQEALILLGFVFVVIGITFYQQRKTQRALEALRDLSSPRADVIRDGRRRRISGAEVVRDDIVLLSEGDRVPADCRVLSATNLTVDESMLTGESAPVVKHACPTGGTLSGTTGVWPVRQTDSRDGCPTEEVVFSGCMVVKGQGVTRVIATGRQTELGKIGKSLAAIEPQRTRLQQETARLVRQLALVGAGLCVIVAVGYALSYDGWLHGILAGLTLAMATLPEEFPMVLTIFLALGAWRISQQRVLTRRVPAVETLGSATVLCVDKTGTLTANEMSVAMICVPTGCLDLRQSRPGRLGEEFHELIEYAVLASKRDPFDPMEKAINALGAQMLAQTEHLHASWQLAREYPLEPDLLALSHVWSSPAGDICTIAAKGAPEAIADLCHLDEPAAAELSRQVQQMAGQGMRVLGVGRADFAAGAAGLGPADSGADLPRAQHDFQFRLVGLVGLADPVRAGVKQAIAECYQAGIRVVMITGDYPVTAQHIAAEIGLAHPQRVLTGAELNAMDDALLAQRVREVNVFARVVPQQKLRLVEALKAGGEVVAMTGDGVNDAPALRAANIGIAMGGRGTDVAREAADLVLLDDDFASIVSSVRVGRRIFDNIKKAVAYIFAIHVPIAGLSLIPVFFADWKLILLPVHIVFLELIIDPACSIVFEAEPEEADVMRRKPRQSDEPLFTWWTILLSLLQGLSVLLVVLGVFLLGRYFSPGKGADEARALAFSTLLVANLGLILTNRCWSRRILGMLDRSNPALWWVLGGAAALLGLVLYVPGLRHLFRFATLHPGDLLLCLCAGLASIVWFEAVKGVLGRRMGRGENS